MKVINKWSQSLSVVICDADVVRVSALSASAGRRVSSAGNAADSGLFVGFLSLWTQLPVVFQIRFLGLPIRTVILWLIKPDLCFQTLQWVEASAQCWETPSELLRVCQWGWKTSHSSSTHHEHHANTPEPNSIWLQTVKKSFVNKFDILYLHFNNQTYMQCWVVTDYMWPGLHNPI